MSVDMIAPAWMHSQITAADYESWSEEQCAGIFVSVSTSLAAVAGSNGNRLDLDDAGISLVSQQAYRCNPFRVLSQQQRLILGERRAKRADA